MESSHFCLTLGQIKIHEVSISYLSQSNPDLNTVMDKRVSASAVSVSTTSIRHVRASVLFPKGVTDHCVAIPKPYHLDVNIARRVTLLVWSCSLLFLVDVETGGTFWCPGYTGIIHFYSIDQGEHPLVSYFCKITSNDADTQHALGPCPAALSYNVLAIVSIAQGCCIPTGESRPCR